MQSGLAGSGVPDSDGEVCKLALVSPAVAGAGERGTANTWMASLAAEARAAAFER